MTRATVFVVPAFVVGLLAGCGGGGEQASTPAAEESAGGAVWQPMGNEGTVTGKVNFQGTAPTYRAISMDADAVCAAAHSGPVYPEAVLANDNGTLRNVFVYVKSGLEGKTFAVPTTSVMLDQKGCMYIPHVIGIQARQNLEVRTDDNTTHNIHPLPKVNREWNISQPPGAQPIMQSFSRPEESIPVKCNQHPWMRAYIHVMSSPFYAVTGADGTFEIKGLPPGDYEIEAVHEEYGGQTQKVTVAANGTATAEFSYTAGQAYQPSSLKMMPALVLP
jgi:hypothetical protein